MTTNNGSENARPKGSQNTSDDAVTLLKNDHRAVEQLFEIYETASQTEKSKLANQICQELIVHTLLEEEIFYPACRESVDDETKLDEAQVEHDGAKALIIELLDGAPSDDFYDAKVKVLSEQVKHHVAEEEKRSEGIFAKAKAAGVDMEDLAEKLKTRKAELKALADQGQLERPQPRSFKSQTAMEDRMPQYRERDEFGRFTDDDRRYASQRSGRGRSRYEDDYDDDRRGGGRDRDESGRFMSDEDDDYGSRRSRGRSMPERDEYGRFMRDDDDDRGGRGSRDDYGYGGRGDDRRFGGGRERDEYGRFTRDDDDDRGARGRGGGGGGRERDEYGRFVSDEDDDFRGRSFRGRGGDRGGRERDEYGRFMSDDDRGGRGRMQSFGGRGRFRDDDDGRGRGRGGWFGDPEGHAEASRRGWESRQDMRGGRSRYDDDDDRRGGGGRGGQGGWFGDPEGHSEAARRGWRNRQ